MVVLAVLLLHQSRDMQQSVAFTNGQWLMGG
jgi:hypothetical protein